MSIAFPSHFEARLDLYGIDTACRSELRRLWPVLQPALREGIDRFIEAEKVMPSVDTIFRTHSDWIRKVETEHLRHVLSGEFGEAYVASCQELSEQEQKIGLTSRTRMIAGTLVLQTAIDALARRFRFSPRKLAAATQVVSRALAFDIATTMTFYQDAALARSEARRKKIEAAICEFEAAIKETVDAVKSVSQSLSAGSTQMGSAAVQTSERMKSAALAARSTADMAEATAAATEEMSQSIAEIGSQSSEGLSLAKRAAMSTSVSTERLKALSDAVGQIGSMVDTISSIAGQTNLLALNATIEAARAGEAGRGFSVVASEVKALAAQTGRATEDIAQQIAAIRHATEQMTSQIDSVAEAVREISSVATSIESAVYEQTAATKEIAASAHKASQTTAQATRDVQTVEAAMQQSLEVVKEFGKLTDLLSSGASDLEAKVARFFSSVRAA